MRVLKIVLYVLLALVGLVLILGVEAPREVGMTRSTVIDAPQQQVFQTVNDLSTWEHWSPWKEMDPEMEVQLGDPHRGEGGYFTWTGEKSGSGKMQIKSSSAPDSLQTHLAFDGQGEADAFWRFEPTEAGVKTSWGFESDFPYPMNAMLLFMDFEGQLAKDYDRGLQLLKQYVEERAANQLAHQLQVREVELPLRHFIAVRGKVKFADMPQHFEQHLPRVYKAVQQAELPVAGAPCGLYFTWDEANQETDMGQAIAIAEPAKLDGFSSINLDASLALMIEYYGSYDGLGAAHQAMDAHLKQHGLTAGVPAIEEYVTDPAEEPDTSKWLTRIYYPLEKES